MTRLQTERYSISVQTRGTQGMHDIDNHEDHAGLHKHQQPQEVDHIKAAEVLPPAALRFEVRPHALCTSIPGCRGQPHQQQFLIALICLDISRTFVVVSNPKCDQDWAETQD